ncbi:pentapeptide repeat-containing protein [Atlantibacter hermannii]|uniref:pentapeptide repeat-containing protein n=1 Tax=Atlantibacter hermannii TaxID=565 RepID=UPI002FDF0A23
MSTFVHRLKETYKEKKIAISRWSTRKIKNLNKEIEKTICALKEINYVISIFLTCVIIIFVLSIINSVYDSTFFISLLGNLNASIWEFLALGIILFFFEKRRQNEDSISDLLSDLENYGTSSSVILDIHKIKIIKELNKRGCFDINVQQIKLHHMRVLKGLIFKDAQIAGMSFYGSALSNCKFINCEIKNLCLKHTLLKNVEFINCKMKNSDLSNGKFSQTKFKGCTLEGAHLKNANLQSCIFTECNFDKVSFENANLRNANLLGSSNLDPQRLAAANNLDYIKCHQDILKNLKLIKPEIKIARDLRC